MCCHRHCLMISMTAAAAAPRCQPAECMCATVCACTWHVLRGRAVLRPAAGACSCRLCVPSFLTCVHLAWRQRCVSSPSLNYYPFVLQFCQLSSCTHVCVGAAVVTKRVSIEGAITPQLYQILTRTRNFTHKPNHGTQPNSSPVGCPVFLRQAGSGVYAQLADL